MSDQHSDGGRILVTGSRTWDDVDSIRSVLAHWWVITGGAGVLVSGGYPRGADRIAETLWRGWCETIERHPAQWARHGRAAGYRRNAAMVAGGARVCVAFIRDDSAGATHCARLAEQTGIDTRRHRYGERFVALGDLACEGCGDPVNDEPRAGWSHRDGSQLCADRRDRINEPVEVTR